MPFIAQGKTSLKYILIVVILAIIVGGGILWCVKKQKEQFAQLPEIKISKETEEIELSEETINKIIKQALPIEYEKYDKKKIKYWKDDINSDGNQEIIITAIPFTHTTQAYLVVITVLNNKGDYKKIADFDFDEINQEKYDIGFGYTPPTIKMVRDINSDGLIEIQLWWDIGAVRPITNDAFLVLDWSNEKINWMQILDEEDLMSPAIFSTGNSASTGGFWLGSIYVLDIDKDNNTEIISLEERGPYSYQSDEDIKTTSWEVKVYEWNGTIFSHNKELSGVMNQEPEWLESVYTPRFLE